jgi:hypothetical protein
MFIRLLSLVARLVAGLLIVCGLFSTFVIPWVPLMQLLQWFPFDVAFFLHGEGEPGWFGTLLMIVGVGVLTFARRLARVSDAPAYPTIGPDDDLQAVIGDPRPPVVYLRSFKDDRAAGRSGARLGPLYLAAVRTEEEQLAHVLSPLGPCVALGRPGERLPRLGMHRVAIAHDDWQATVRRWMSAARLVVIRTGSTPGLRWEIDTAAGLLRPEQVVLLVPRGRRARREARRITTALSGSASPAIPGTLNWNQSVSAMITFGPAWVPRVTRLRLGMLPDDFRMPHAPMFRRALRQAGLEGS